MISILPLFVSRDPAFSLHDQGDLEGLAVDGDLIRHEEELIQGLLIDDSQADGLPWFVSHCNI